MKDSKVKRFLVQQYEIFYEIRRKFLLKTKYHMRIMNPKRTIKYIMKHNCSISRFGDGEFLLILNEPIGFQTNSAELSKKLKDVLGGKNKNLLVCIPRCMNSLRDCNDIAKSYWNDWGKTGNHQIEVSKMIKSIAKKFYLFGDAQITRPYIDWKNEKRALTLFPMLKALWDKKDIIIVEGSQTRLGVGNDLFDNAKSIKRIITPPLNAFNKYEDIKKSIIDIHTNELVLLAIGPTATVLANDLSLLGKIQALDIGHIDIEYEWYLMKAKKKTIVKGKYVNEVHGGKIFTDCKDEKYLNQIIKIIE